MRFPFTAKRMFATCTKDGCSTLGPPPIRFQQKSFCVVVDRMYLVYEAASSQSMRADCSQRMHMSCSSAPMCMHSSLPLHSSRGLDMP